MRPRHTTRPRHAVLAFTALLTMSAIVMPLWTMNEARAEDDFEDGDDPEIGEDHYEEATRFVRFKAYTKALASFKKALPYMNEESDVYFNLVNVANALKKYEEVYFYGAAFLRIEPDGDDSRGIILKMKKAGSTLKSKRRAPAEVRFRVRPKGTPLYVNDVPVGDSGGPPLMFPAGTYTVRGKIEGYHPFEETFTVNPRTPMTVKGSFEKIKYYGHLAIETFEAPCAWPCSALRAALDHEDKSKLGLRVAKGVRVFVNDSLVGETPMDKLKLLADRYLVRFERDGWDEWTRYVQIMRDDVQSLQPILERTPPKKADKKTK